LMEFPLGVFGIALSTVILPKLSGQYAAKDHDSFNKTLDWALRLVLLIAIPASAGLFILAEPMLSLLFQRGEFTLFDVEMASVSLMAYALGLVGFILVKVLVSGYFSQQNTRTPVKFGIIAMVANMVMNLIFVGAMVMNDYHAPHAGLALATAASSLLNAWLLYRGLRHRGIYSHLPGWGRLIMQITVALSVMVLFLYMVAPHGDFWQDAPLWSRIGVLAGEVMGAALLYFSTLFLLGIRPTEFQKR